MANTTKPASAADAAATDGHGTAVPHSDEHGTGEPGTATSSAASDFARAAGARPRSFAGEFWQFARQNKRWWLTPILVTLLVVGLLVVLGATAAGPFVYSLF